MPTALGEVSRVKSVHMASLVLQNTTGPTIKYGNCVLAIYQPYHQISLITKQMVCTHTHTHTEMTK